MKEAFSMPLQGWDAFRILLQITSLQTIHYLILATLLPPFLAIFADTSSLMFEGGPTQVGMVFDWRQVAGRPTYDWSIPTTSDENGWTDDGYSPDQEKVKGIPGSNVAKGVLVDWNLDNVWLDQPLLSTPIPGQGQILDHDHVLRFKHYRNGSVVPDPDDDAAGGKNVQQAIEHWEWDHTRDTARSYTLILTWLLTIPLDIFLLVYLVRRPTHMLDHALTFHLVNLAICTWYVGRLPRGLRWWLTMMVHAGVMVVWSEQLAIKREMGRGVGYNLVGHGDEEEGGPRRKIFDAEDEVGDQYELRPL